VVEGSCTTCGIADVGDEFHPHALCLLVKTRDGIHVMVKQETDRA
jgi:hypothetical protein